MNNTTPKVDAIDKMRNIISWADWQNETFNQRIKSIKDIEKLYDYAQANDIEFLDGIYSGDFTDEEIAKIEKDTKKLLGYSIYR